MKARIEIRFANGQISEKVMEGKTIQSIENSAFKYANGENFSLAIHRKDISEKPFYSQLYLQKVNPISA